jgi:hypothetical protein
MTAPGDPLTAASNVKTQAGAARLYWALENEIGTGNHDAGWEDDARDAQDELANDWGGHNALRQLASHGGRQRAAAPKQAAKPAAPAKTPAARSARAAPPAPSGRTPGSPRKPAPRTTRPAPRANLRGRGAGRRAFRQTGIPAAAGSSAAFALQILGLMIGMALLYLVLTDAERSRRGGIFATVLTGTTSILHRFISPADPLAHRKKGVQGYDSYDAAVAGGAVAGPAVPGDIRGQPPKSASGALGVPPIGGFPATTTP